MSDFEFIVIEKVVNESEDHLERRLLTREAFWCSQLCTLHDHGLSVYGDELMSGSTFVGLRNRTVLKSICTHIE